MKLFKATVLLMLLLIPLVSATSIGETTIKVSVVNNTLKIIDEVYSGNNKEIQLVVTNNSANLVEWELTLLFVKNESVGTDIVEKYTTCLGEKSTCEVNSKAFDMAWNVCRVELGQYTGENSTVCETELVTCKAGIGEKENTIVSRDSQITELNDDANDNQNSKWIFGVGGLALGLFFYAMKKGEVPFLQKNPKDASKEFNKNQAG